MNWTCLNSDRKYMDGHLVYTDGNRIALADWSIRDKCDPSTTDDGLLILDESRPIRIRWKAGDKMPWTHIPLRNKHGEDTATCEGLMDGLATCELLSQHTSIRIEIDPKLLSLVARLSALQASQDWS